jgi:hypothetical protein
VNESGCDDAHRMYGLNEKFVERFYWSKRLGDQRRGSYGRITLKLRGFPDQPTNCYCLRKEPCSMEYHSHTGGYKWLRILLTGGFGFFCCSVK